MMKPVGALIAIIIGLGVTHAAEVQSAGPFNVDVLEGSVGLEHALAADSPIAAPNAPWSITSWIRPSRRQSGTVPVAVVGDTVAPAAQWRGIELLDGEIALQVTPAATLRSGTVVEADHWYGVAATFDGVTARLYVDGRESAAISAATPRVRPRIEIAPRFGAEAGKVSHFGGSVAELLVSPGALELRTVQALADRPPEFSLITFEDLGVGWPLQEHAWRGLQVPQDAWTLPHGKSDASSPIAEPTPAISSAIEAQQPDLWTVAAWRMRAAPEVAAGGETLSQPGYPDADWHAAVVPGHGADDAHRARRLPGPRLRSQ